MMEKLIIFLFICLVLFLYWYKEKRKAEKIFSKAIELEQNNEYEEACYVYAIALDSGCKKKKCHKKIRELWQIHGPFDFKKVLDKYGADDLDKKSHGSRYNDFFVEEIQNIIISSPIESET
jgi:hypothetical protein